MSASVLARLAAAALGLALLTGTATASSNDPELIFKKSTVWKLLTPDDKLAVYAIDDPEVEGVACHFTVPERGGLKGMIGVAEQTSDVSLACRQVGPVKFKRPLAQGDEMFRERRSLFFKKMQIVRGCDPVNNVLVYISYTDKLIEGSPQNNVTAVPVPAAVPIPLR